MSENFERYTETNVVASLVIYEWAAELDIFRAHDILDKIVEIIALAPDIATVAGEKTSRDYLYRNFVKLDVLHKREWQALSYLWKRSVDTLSDFAIEIACSPDSFRCFEIHIDKAAVADFNGTFQKIIRLLCEELQPVYGIGLSMPYFWGPRAFAHGSASSRFATVDKTVYGPPPEMKEQFFAFGPIFRAEGATRQLDQKLRDLFPFNLLSEGHLDRQIDGKRLENWIEENSFGVLRKLSAVTWQWDVPLGDVQTIRRRLIDADLTVVKQ
ncbi:hypothetical protein RFM68_00120 [Mesorhizobium sp. MSK_1335]|uniref:DUF3396 domain-containing protein n=1 Tax=Mesorhizobium montanum TaxID=3072323 RepID=A0ABU4ZBZ0_9HYPH|nr:hypothetical protein [Mesorhizobium sp. MSK_1335]MDX8522902.1 hypothetical protein [Mesorhizobium sp. MSK_1335]